MPKIPSLLIFCMIVSSCWTPVKPESVAPGIYLSVSGSSTSFVVTVKNQGLPDRNLSGYTLGCTHNPDYYSIPFTTMLPKNSEAAFSSTALGFTLDPGSDKVFLKFGTTIIAQTDF